jgi:hypothetical protein
MNASLNLNDPAYLALRRGTTQSEMLADEIDMGFEFKKRVGLASLARPSAGEAAEQEQEAKEAGE